MTLDVTRWSTHLARHVPLARRGVDPEGVHQVRVASRRLRVWLALGNHHALGDDLRALCRSLGFARDLELIAEVNELRPFYLAQKVVAQALVVDALEPTRMQALLAALEVVPAPTQREARSRLSLFERRTCESLERFRRRRTFDALHRVRRDVRALRYAREWLGLDATKLSHAQAGLGHVCDVMVFERLLTIWALETGRSLAPLARIERALAEAL